MTKTFRFLVAAAGVATLLSAAPVHAAGEAPIPPSQRWSWANPVFGMFDRAQLQRGFQVYREVCSSCHGMNLLAYRNLYQEGGPEFTREQAQAIAAQFRTRIVNDAGESVERPAILSDRFVAPFPNRQAAAAANNGKAPPDLSVIAKARTYPRGFPWFIGDAITGFNFDQGANYLYAFLTGYREPPADAGAQPDGTHYNYYYPGHWVAMPNILNDGQVTYRDGSPQTVSQYARDVTAFMVWAAEPHMEARRRIGFQVLVFLILFAGLLYYTKKKVWRDVAH